MGVRIWRKKAEDRSLWAMIVKEALVRLEGPCAKEEENALNVQVIGILIKCK
jgi:hypothetical protein